MERQGFSKLTALKAFLRMTKACNSECHCTPVCQLFMAKEILGEAAKTGEKFSDKIPKDILDMYRSVPILPERYNQIELLDAFSEVQSICDNCPVGVHGSFCTVNVVLTGLGVLIYGKEFKTDKDQESQ
ncbi:nitrite reductase [Desulfitobacterium sp.]|uniref:nitrite reductase n=1 Tax=Desulfitobacterium sp. TaxID=49981 RepID=UPI002BC05A72|nr:nitrite reductase [Desulfitobacterium sp.]HVJ50782.1 nitrite reductase [Desulfitobacterium sp.]